LQFGASSVAVEDGELEFIHDIAVRMSLDLVPDASERTIQDLENSRIDLRILAILRDLEGLPKSDLNRSGHSSSPLVNQEQIWDGIEAAQDEATVVSSGDEFESTHDETDQARVHGRAFLRRVRASQAEGTRFGTATGR